MGLERCQERFDGERSVRLAGREFIVAPLSLRAIMALADYVPKLAAAPTDVIDSTRIEPLVDTVLLALKRTYPTLTKEELLDLPIRLDELRAAVDVVIEQAGGRKVDPALGEQKPPDQVRGASDLKPSTGESSSPTS